MSLSHTRAAAGRRIARPHPRGSPRARASRRRRAERAGDRAQCEAWCERRLRRRRDLTQTQTDARDRTGRGPADRGCGEQSGQRRRARARGAWSTVEYVVCKSYNERRETTATRHTHTQDTATHHSPQSPRPRIAAQDLCAGASHQQAPLDMESEPAQASPAPYHTRQPSDNAPRSDSVSD